MRQTHRNRQAVIGDIIEAEGLRVCAEIGVGTGPTTRAILARFPDIRWIAVDCWPADLPLHYGGVLSAEQQAERRGRFLENVTTYGERLTLIEKDTVEAANDVEDGSLDLVFIDADHSYEGCKADIIAWRSKVRPGGWLMGHDYHKGNFPGVVQAVDEMVPGFTLDADDVWVVRV